MRPAMKIALAVGISIPGTVSSLYWRMRVIIVPNLTIAIQGAVAMTVEMDLIATEEPC
jgi:hypothetical protein